MAAYATGDFGVVPTRGGVGLLIRLGQWLNGDGIADFEHAFVYVGNGQIVEAEPNGAVLRPVSEYDGWRVAWFHCPMFQGAAIADEARKLVGTPYSWLDYWALAAMHFHLPIGDTLRQRVKDSGFMICSQLVDESYRRASVHLFNDDRWPGDVTPGDLYKLIVEQRSREG